MNKSTTILSELQEYFRQNEEHRAINCTSNVVKRMSALEKDRFPRSEMPLVFYSCMTYASLSPLEKVVLSSLDRCNCLNASVKF